MYSQRIRRIYNDRCRSIVLRCATIKRHYTAAAPTNAIQRSHRPPSDHPLATSLAISMLHISVFIRMRLHYVTAEDVSRICAVLYLFYCTDVVHNLINYIVTILL